MNSRQGLGHFGPGPRQNKDSPPRDLGIIRISHGTFGVARRAKVDRHPHGICNVKGFEFSIIQHALVSIVHWFKQHC